MDRKTLKRIIKSFGDEWYYYYNFDGIEVCKNLKKDKTSGMYNWREKLEPLVLECCSHFSYPCIFDIGCNMALYGHEMTKRGIDVYAIDKNVEIAKFFRKYIKENTDEEWKVKLMQCDITERHRHLQMSNVCIITMFCVLYHFEKDVDNVFAKLPQMFPNHRFVMLQGNKPRVKKKKQKIAGVEGMVELLEKFGYKTKMFEWNDYQKPVVLGDRNEQKR